MLSWLKKTQKSEDSDEELGYQDEPSIQEVLLSTRPSDTFAYWADSGYLAQVIPDLDDLRRVSQMPAHVDNAFIHTMKAVDAIEPTLIRRWAALLHDIGKGPTYLETPSGRTHFFEHDRIGSEMAVEIMSAHGEEGATVNAVQCLVRMHMRPISYRPEWTDSAVRRLVEEAEEVRGRAGWNDLIAVSRADLRGYLPEPIDRGLWVLDSLEARRKQIDDVDQRGAYVEAHESRSPLDGNELLSLTDREPGPWVAELKDYLCQEVEAGHISRDDKALATALAVRWLGENNGVRR